MVDRSGLASCTRVEDPARRHTALVSLVIDLPSPASRSDALTRPPTFVTRTIERRGILLAVHGELDLASAPQLARRIREALCLPVGRVTLELSHVEFMDSQGLHVLEDARAAAAERHVDLVLESPAECVRTVLDVTGTTDEFDIRTRERTS
jgi:anti-anti-sigma factor